MIGFATCKFYVMYIAIEIKGLMSSPLSANRKNHISSIIKDKATVLAYIWLCTYCKVVIFSQRTEHKHSTLGDFSVFHKDQLNTYAIFRDLLSGTEPIT